MDRRNALLALLVLALFACEDDYGSPCKKNGCKSRDGGEAGSSWSTANDVTTSGTVTIDGETHAMSTVSAPYAARRDGFALTTHSPSTWVSPPSTPTPNDAGADGYAYTPTYDTSRRLRVTFDAQTEIGTHDLAKIRAVAIVCPRGSGLRYGDYDTACTDARGDAWTPEVVELEGTLTVLDVRIDVGQPGVPSEPLSERPWGWAMKTTNQELAIDVRAESKPTWYVYDNSCD